VKPTAALASDVLLCFSFNVANEKRGCITPAKSLIPEKYLSSDDTDVTVTVSPSGGDVSIQLSSE
jgi:hypothetical protein